MASDSESSKKTHESDKDSKSSRVSSSNKRTQKQKKKHGRASRKKIKSPEESDKKKNDNKDKTKAQTKRVKKIQTQQYPDNVPEGTTFHSEESGVQLNERSDPPGHEPTSTDNNLHVVSRQASRRLGVKSKLHQQARQSVYRKKKSSRSSSSTSELNDDITSPGAAPRVGGREEGERNEIPSRPGAQRIMGLGRSGWGSGVVDSEGGSQFDSGSLSIPIENREGETSAPLIPEAVVAPDIGLIVQDAVQEALRKRDEEAETEERAEIVQGVVVENENEGEAAGWRLAARFIVYAMTLMGLVTVIALAVVLAVDKHEIESSHTVASALSPTLSPTESLPPTLEYWKETMDSNSMYGIETYSCDESFEKLTYSGPINQGTVVKVCMQPNQKAWNEGMTIRSVDNFEFSRILPDNSIRQPAITNGRPDKNDLTEALSLEAGGQCFDGVGQCYFESILFAAFYATPGTVVGKGTATMQLISETSNVTVVSRLEIDFDVAQAFPYGTGGGTSSDDTGPRSGLWLGLIFGVITLIFCVLSIYFEPWQAGIGDDESGSEDGGEDEESAPKSVQARKQKKKRSRVGQPDRKKAAKRKEVEDGEKEKRKENQKKVNAAKKKKEAGKGEIAAVLPGNI